MTNNMLSRVESISFVAPYYRVQLDEPMSKAQEITNHGTDPFQTYINLKEFSNSLAEKLDSAIIARGGTATNGKRILIAIGRQRLYMLENHNIVYEMPASTGIKGHGTAAGEFQVYEKVPMAWGYYHIWMPYWLTVYYSGGLGNGIHGIPISPVSGRWSSWDNVVGVSPITYGCIMPHDWDAKIVYEWADIGTPVSIVY
ncbi:MAG: L,D-transpeptidase, partial [Patescibacteria group bacterium]|nr:L,D-transpeptidase [Patescibacteria group bacterium]